MTASLFLPRSSVRSVYSISVSGIVQASAPICPVDSDFEAEDSLELLLRGAQYKPHVKAFRVIGQSMSGIIEHGDIVLVDSQDEFNTNRPCIFETPNGYVVKLRGLHEGRFALLSAPGANIPPITDMTDIYPRGCVYARYKRPYAIQYVS